MDDLRADLLALKSLLLKTAAGGLAEYVGVPENEDGSYTFSEEQLLCLVQAVVTKCAEACETHKGYPTEQSEKIRSLFSIPLLAPSW